MSNEVLPLGGRLYAPAQTTTFAQDNYLRKILLRTGLQAKINGGEDLLDAVLTCDELPALLAGFLVPIDTPWSREVAEASATVFEGLTDPEEKQRLMDMVTLLLVSFFGGAGTSNASSPNASTPAPDPAPAASPASPQRRRRRAAASGAPSSSPSATTTDSPPPS